MSQENEEEEHWVRRKIVEVFINNAVSLLFVGGIGAFIISQIKEIRLSTIWVIVIFAVVIYVAFVLGIVVTLRAIGNGLVALFRLMSKKGSTPRRRGSVIAGIILLPVVKVVMATVMLFISPRYTIQQGWWFISDGFKQWRAKKPSKKELQETITQMQAEKEKEKEQTTRLHAEIEELKAELAKRQTTEKPAEETSHLQASESGNDTQAPVTTMSHTRTRKTAKHVQEHQVKQ
ncbi:MAG TPA: hypothetical protein VKT82_28980 [Ktedonobacterales bacterium]|nr:hypothetical protein [Ktedonobacterales bacterium]